MAFSFHPVKHGFCADTTVNNSNFKDGHMDADIDDDSDTELDTDTLNKQSLDSSLPKTGPAKGVVYIKVHYIDNVNNDDFKKIMSKAKETIGKLKKDNEAFHGEHLIQAMNKSMQENKEQSDRFINSLRDYKIETSYRDVVFADYPVSINCDEDDTDNENITPPKSCYSITVENRKSKGDKNIEVNAETVWQGSMVDHDFDEDNYHLDIKNTDTIWLYRGIPADVDGNKRVFFFEITVAISPDLLNK